MQPQELSKLLRLSIFDEIHSYKQKILHVGMNCFNSMRLYEYRYNIYIDMVHIEGPGVPQSV
jgi:hypothetical protein